MSRLQGVTGFDEKLSQGLRTAHAVPGFDFDGSPERGRRTTVPRLHDIVLLFPYIPSSLQILLSFIMTLSNDEALQMVENELKREGSI